VDEAEVDEDGEDVMELQNARTTVMGVGNYSVPIDIVKHLSVRSIEAFRPLSAMWHRFLGLDGRQGAQQEAQVSAVDLNRQKRRRQGSHERREDVEEGEGGELVSRRGKGWVSSKRERAIRKAMQQVLG
jgi:hypothetical protein